MNTVEIGAKLEKLIRDSKQSLESTKDELKEARRYGRSTFTNDLINQQNILETRIDFGEMMLELVKEVDDRKQSLGRKFSIPLADKVEVEEVEDEEAIFNRFRSR